MFLKQRAAFEAKLLEAARGDVGVAARRRWFQRFGTSD